MAKAKNTVPVNISEEYYQISENILGSFSKYRPPVDLFRFNEDILQLYPFSRKGQRLTNEQIEEMQALCLAGDLFVSRSDHPIYSEHIIKQLDLVLQDANLKMSEIADIIVRGLSMRLKDFLEQPVLPVFEALYKDLMVFTEFLFQDIYRIRLFMRRLVLDDYSLVEQAINTLVVGMWMYLQDTGKEVKRRTMDRIALGLILHDAGLSKVPAYILGKAAPLKQDEWEKVLVHPIAGIKMMQKLNLAFDELNQAISEHHERLDGSGYPQHRKAPNISTVGRIAAIADSFSSMIMHRPYSRGMEPKQAALTLEKEKNRYDPKYLTMLANAYKLGTFDLPKAPDAQATQAAPASEPAKSPE